MSCLSVQGLRNPETEFFCHTTQSAKASVSSPLALLEANREEHKPAVAQLTEVYRAPVSYSFGNKALIPSGGGGAFPEDWAMSGQLHLNLLKDGKTVVSTKSSFRCATIKSFRHQEEILQEVGIGCLLCWKEQNLFFFSCLQIWPAPGIHWTIFLVSAAIMQFEEFEQRTHTQANQTEQTDIYGLERPKKGRFRFIGTWNDSPGMRVYRSSAKHPK